MQGHQRDDFGIPVVHDVESAELLKHVWLQARLGHTQEAEEAQDLVSVVLLGHFVLNGLLDRFEVLTQHDLLLERVAVRVV